MHWATKALSIRIAERVAPTLTGADPTVLANLLEVCTHWLAAGRVGATLVWSLDGDPAALGHLGMAPAVAIPELDLTSRTHFAPLLNALAQYDRAALVDPGGRIATVGVHLRSSEASRRDLAPYRGTRHTAALRFSAEEPLGRRVRGLVERGAVGLLAGPPSRHRLTGTERPPGDGPRRFGPDIGRICDQYPDLNRRQGVEEAVGEEPTSRRTSSESRTSNGNGSPAR